MQMEHTQLPPPGGDAGGYYGSAAGIATQVAQPNSGWNDTANAYPTWDDQSAAAAGAAATNPFATAGYVDPNAAWNNGSAGGASYGAIDNNNSASFYETRAQYVQPSSQYQ